MVTNVSSSSACESQDFSNSDWTTAYYMSRVDKIRAILDHGQPLPIGMTHPNLFPFFKFQKNNCFLQFKFMAITQIKIFRLSQSY